MADRSFIPPLGSLEPGVTEIFCKLTVGAGGAVTAGTGNGITSVTKETAAGQYTVLLSDTYAYLLGMHFTLVDSTDSDPSTVAIMARVKSEAVATTGAIVIQGFAYDDGAAANFRNGAVLYMVIKLKNSTVV